VPLVAPDAVRLLVDRQTGIGARRLLRRRDGRDLTREQIIETVNCGRPGTGMPFHLRGAYDATKCYDSEEGGAVGERRLALALQGFGDVGRDRLDLALAQEGGRIDPAAALIAALVSGPALAATADPTDLREVRVGMPVTDLPMAGFDHLTCRGSSPTRRLSSAGWPATLVPLRASS
jgi:hypothetical protein